MEEKNKKITSINLVKKTFSSAPERIRMQFENISLDQRNVLGLHCLLNLINRCKRSIAFIIFILNILIGNYKFKIFETNTNNDKL